MFATHQRVARRLESHDTHQRVGELEESSMDDDLGEIQHESGRFIVIRRASGDLVDLARRVDVQGTFRLVTANADEGEVAAHSMACRVLRASQSPVFLTMLEGP
jgi:hypothetical protein